MYVTCEWRLLGCSLQKFWSGFKCITLWGGKNLHALEMLGKFWMVKSKYLTFPPSIPPSRAAGTVGARQARHAAGATRRATAAPSASTRTGRSTTMCAGRHCRHSSKARRLAPPAPQALPAAVLAALPIPPPPLPRHARTRLARHQH